MLKQLSVVLAALFLFSNAAIAEDENLILKDEEQYTFESNAIPEDLIKKKLDYPANIIVGWVDSCASRMMQYMGMHPMQARPIALKMCSCLMDQFRSDFDYSQFTKGGVKLANQMAEEYGEVCKQLEFGKKYPM